MVILLCADVGVGRISHISDRIRALTLSQKGMRILLRSLTSKVQLRDGIRLPTPQPTFAKMSVAFGDAFPVAEWLSHRT